MASILPQNSYDFADLVALQEIILEATNASLDTYYNQCTADYKSDGSIVTEADLMMQRLLTQALARRFPGVQMLGEEISEAEQLAVLSGSGDFWCLDPIDGTTNFHATMPLFSVSLGLVSAGEIVLGIVYDPNRGEFFGAIRGQGFWINGQRVSRPPRPDSVSGCIAFVDFKRLDKSVGRRLVQETPYKSQRNIGTCALEWAWLAAGRAHLLTHGSEKLWDYAAGVLLNEEAGGISETYAGEPVFAGTLDTRPVIAASDPAFFDDWAAFLRQSE